MTTPKEKPLSRQRLWQLQRQESGLCRSCSKPAGGASYCFSCRKKNKAAYREKAGPSNCTCSWCHEVGHNVRTCSRITRQPAGFYTSEGWPPPRHKRERKKIKRDFGDWPK